MHVLEQDRIIKTMAQFQNMQSKNNANEKSNLIGSNNLDSKYGAINNVYNEFNKPVSISTSPRSSLSSKGSPKFSTTTTVISPKFSATNLRTTMSTTNDPHSSVKNTSIPDRKKSESIVTTANTTSPKQKVLLNSPRLKSIPAQDTSETITPNINLSSSLQDINTNNSKIVSQVNDVAPTSEFLFTQPTKFPIREDRSNSSSSKSSPRYE
jgi:hypothetical protein